MFHLHLKMCSLNFVGVNISVEFNYIQLVEYDILLFDFLADFSSTNSVSERGLLKFQTIIVNLFMYPFRSDNFCFIYFEAGFCFCINIKEDKFTSLKRTFLFSSICVYFTQV